jgi:hypothetical protein
MKVIKKLLAIYDPPPNRTGLLLQILHDQKNGVRTRTSATGPPTSSPAVGREPIFQFRILKTDQKSLFPGI